MTALSDVCFMKSTRHGYLACARRAVRLLLFLSPLLALPPFARHAPHPPVEKHEPPAALQSSAPVSMLSTKNAEPALNILLDPSWEGDVRVPDDESSHEFSGWHLHLLSDSIKIHPRASRFYIHWETVDAGSHGTYTIWYDRTKHTLRSWSYDSMWEAGMPTHSFSVYRKVTDRIINKITAKSPDHYVGTESDLVKYGCTCWGKGCPATDHE